MILYNRDRQSWKQFISDSSTNNQENRFDSSREKVHKKNISSKGYTVKRVSHDSSVYHPHPSGKKMGDLDQKRQKQKELLNVFTSMPALRRYIQTHDSKHETGNINDMRELLQKVFSMGDKFLKRYDRVAQAGAYFHWKLALYIHRNAISRLNEDDLCSQLGIPEFQKERRYYVVQACKHFLNDLYDESLDNLTLAENYEKYDPFILYTKGLIHQYVISHLDIDLALTLFLQSAKYFQAENTPQYVSESFFHASNCAYILKKDNDAIQYAEKALAISPDFHEAAYSLARLKATIGDESCVKLIKNLVEQNLLYGFKAHLDDTFLPVVDKLFQTFVGLRNAAKSECDTIHLAMIADRHLEKYQQRHPDDFSQWKSLFNEANQIYQKNSYMDYRDACPILQESDTYYQAFKHGHSLKKKQRPEPIHLYEKQQHQFVNTSTSHTKKDTEIAEKEIFDLLNETKSLVHHNTDFQYLTRVTQAQASEKIAYLLDNPIACIDLATLSDHKSSVLTIAFSPCGTRLASGSEDGVIRIWDLENYQSINVIKGHKKAVNCLRFSPNGNYFASASWDKTIKLWDFQTCNEIATLTGHSDSVEILDISMDSMILASGSNDQTVRLWDCKKMQHVHTFDNFSDNIRSLCFSPDGLQLAAGSWDIVQLWDVLSKKQIHIFKGQTRNYISALAISPDGLTLAAGSHDKSVRLLDMTSKKQALKLQGHLRRINCVAFSPDNLTLASGSHDKQVKLWNVKTGKEINGLSVHKDFVSAVAFSPDGMMLASASHDTHIRLWQIHYKIMPKDALDEIIERNAADASRRRQAQWRADMRCEVCGERLGFIDIFKGRIRCHKHE